jgi:two-component system, chemotaxis family, CheB/CheR fusion protein
MAQRREPTLDSLLEFVRDTRGFDFTGYKRTSIQRRVAKRMSDLNIDRYEDYLDYLQLHGDEFAELFNTLLIKVTSFFRDGPTWEHLATSTLPQLIASRPEDSPFRVWSAGCSSGEEAYTLAMVLARVMGEAEFRNRVKIYATDVDEEALDRARHATYAPRQVEDVPSDALERFFERTDQRYVLRKDLRRCVIFGRNDLIVDAPISRIDLLVCRNTLMYFTAETQSQILRRFHFGLDDDGVLMLGKSEMLITHADLFAPIDLKWRMFRKVIRPALRDRIRVMADAGDGALPSGMHTLREAAFDLSGSAHVVVDSGGALVMANKSARRMFGLGINEIGRPIQNLELYYRPIDLRDHLERVSSEARSLDLFGIRWGSGERERVLNVRLAPLLLDGTWAGTSISYADVTDGHALQDRLTSSKQELEQAYEELQSTVEELETTNEELQSTNEELETTNEELQSTNEELETTNEELQSTNEELETMNDELRHRTLELNDVNAFLETILTTIGLAVAVLDRNQHVQIWNGQARDLWGLTAEEAEDRHLMALDIGLPVEKLKPHLRAALSGQSSREEVVLDATNRRGKPLQIRVTVLPLASSSGREVSGAIVMMEPTDGAGPAT